MAVSSLNRLWHIKHVVCCCGPGSSPGLSWRSSGPAAPAVRPEPRPARIRTEAAETRLKATRIRSSTANMKRVRPSVRPSEVKSHPGCGQTDGQLPVSSAHTLYNPTPPPQKQRAARRLDGCCPGGNGSSADRPPGGCSSGLSAANHPAQEITQSRLIINRARKNKPN